MRNHTKKLTITKLLLALAALALLAGACSPSSGDDASAEHETSGDASVESDAGGAVDEEEAEAATDELAVEDTESTLSASADSVEDASAESDEGAQAASGGGLVPSGVQAVNFGRDIVFTANVAVEVPDVATATLQAATAVQSLGGMVFGQQTTTTGTPTTTLVFKVPPAQFQQALADLGKVGYVLSQAISADDVTERVVDLESRIITAQASVIRLRGFLDGATSLEAIAQLEAELLRRETDLEVLRGQLRTLQEQVSLATITLTITQKVPGPEVQLTETFLAGEPACPGSEDLTVAEGEALTLCFAVVNSGDTHLTDFVITDVAFDVDAGDVVLVSGDLDQPLAPGEQILFSATAEADVSRAAQGRVQAKAVDAEGNDLRQSQVAGGSETFLTVEPDNSLPGFLSGLSTGWAVLLRALSAFVLALGFLLPFVWVLPVIWFLRRLLGQRRLAKIPPAPQGLPVMPTMPETPVQP